MAFNNTTGVWTTDDATDLKTSAAFGAVDNISQANGTFLVGTTLDLDYVARTVLVRIDSGSLTMVNDETIVAALQGNNIARVGMWVNGGDLTIDGGADAFSATTPFVVNSITPDTGAAGPFRTSQAGIALTSGNLTLGSAANPVVKFISTKSITVDPGQSDISITGGNAGPCSLNVGTLIFENPRFNIDSALSNRWPNLGFREASANFTVGASSFDTLIGKGIKILDVSGADAANAGMLPVNVEGTVIFIGDNGTGSRFNNLVGVPYIGSATSEITWSFETNTGTAAGNTGLNNSNWFIIGDYDVIPGIRRRLANQKGGAALNKQITFNGANNSTTQRFWLPESNARLTTATATSIEDHNSLAGAAELVPHGITPVTGAGATNDYQIGGANGAYSLTSLPLHNSLTPDTDFYRIRTGLVWNQGNGATGVNSTVVRQHEDNQYLFAGSFVNRLSAQPINFNSTQGAVFPVQDADDTFITNIDVANRNVLADFTVQLPTLAGSSTATGREVNIFYTGTADLTIQPHNLITLVKNEMMTRLTSEIIHTTVEATANDRVVDYLDGFINGTDTWNLRSATAQLDLLIEDTDGTYSTQSNWGDLDTSVANVTIVSLPITKVLTIPTPRDGFYAITRLDSNVETAVLQAPTAFTAGDTLTYEMSDTGTNSFTTNDSIKVFVKYESEFNFNSNGSWNNGQFYVEQAQEFPYVANSDPYTYNDVATEIADVLIDETERTPTVTLTTQARNGDGGLGATKSINGVTYDTPANKVFVSVDTALNTSTNFTGGNVLHVSGLIANTSDYFNSWFNTRADVISGEDPSIKTDAPILNYIQGYKATCDNTRITFGSGDTSTAAAIGGTGTCTLYFQHNFAGMQVASPDWIFTLARAGAPEITTADPELVFVNPQDIRDAIDSSNTRSVIDQTRSDIDGVNTLLEQTARDTKYTSNNLDKASKLIPTGTHTSTVPDGTGE